MLRLLLKIAFAAIFLASGVWHFANPDFYARMIPEYLPSHLVLVRISGAAEVLFGVALLVPVGSRLAAWGLIGLLCAVFPANLHMALHSAEFSEFSAALLWARLPIQVVLMSWAYFYTRRP